MHRKYLCVLGAVLLTAIPLQQSQAGEEAASWLVPVQTLVETKPPPPEKGTNPNRLAISPDGHWIAAVCNQSHALVLYRRRADDGTLTRVASLPNCAFHRPVFSADSRFLYVPSDKLQVYALDEAGNHDLIQELANGKEGVAGMRVARHCCLPADGRNFYVSTVNDRTLVCFTRDPQTGHLKFQECLQDHTASLPHPGTNVVIARLVPNARKTDGVGSIESLQGTPDGRQLFVGTREGLQLAIWDRDATSGRLMLRTMLQDQPHYRENGIRSVQEIAFSRNGKVMVAANNLAGVSLFTRDPNGDKPAFQQIFLESAVVPPDAETSKRQGVLGLTNPVSLAMLPDESGIIVASVNDSSLHLFDLDADVPNLTWKATAFASEAGLGDFLRPQDIAISPDGRFLYVSSNAATVAVYEIRR